MSLLLLGPVPRYSLLSVSFCCGNVVISEPCCVMLFVHRVGAVGGLGGPSWCRSPLSVGGPLGVG
jgi:hypothetical protein